MCENRVMNQVDEVFPARVVSSICSLERSFPPVPGKHPRIWSYRSCRYTASCVLRAKTGQTMPGICLYAIWKWSLTEEGDRLAADRRIVIDPVSLLERLHAIYV